MVAPWRLGRRLRRLAIGLRRRHAPLSGEVLGALGTHVRLGGQGLNVDVLDALPGLRQGVDESLLVVFDAWHAF